ncbi:hypothetical protein ACR3K2_14690 [Cryptosporidium serpentis]
MLKKIYFINIIFLTVKYVSCHIESYFDVSPLYIDDYSHVIQLHSGATGASTDMPIKNILTDIHNSYDHTNEKLEVLNTNIRSDLDSSLQACSLGTKDKHITPITEISCNERLSNTDKEILNIYSNDKVKADPPLEGHFAMSNKINLPSVNKMISDTNPAEVGFKSSGNVLSIQLSGFRSSNTGVHSNIGINQPCYEGTEKFMVLSSAPTNKLLSHSSSIHSDLPIAQSSKLSSVLSDSSLGSSVGLSSDNHVTPYTDISPNSNSKSYLKQYMDLLSTGHSDTKDSSSYTSSVPLGLSSELPVDTKASSQSNTQTTPPDSSHISSNTATLSPEDIAKIASSVGSSLLLAIGGAVGGGAAYRRNCMKRKKNISNQLISKLKSQSIGNITGAILEESNLPGKKDIVGIVNSANEVKRSLDNKPGFNRMVHRRKRTNFRISKNNQELSEGSSITVMLLAALRLFLTLLSFQVIGCSSTDASIASIFTLADLILPFAQMARTISSLRTDAKVSSRYDSLIHPEYKHLQYGTDAEISNEMKYRKKRRYIKKKLLILPEDLKSYEGAQESTQESTQENTQENTQESTQEALIEGYTNQTNMQYAEGFSKVDNTSSHFILREINLTSPNFTEEKKNITISPPNQAYRINKIVVKRNNIRGDKQTKARSSELDMSDDIIKASDISNLIQIPLPESEVPPMHHVHVSKL